MRIHILGIGGTFMAGIAQIAIQAGHEVTGSDQNLYPPMSTQLRALGISVQNYDQPLPPSIDCVIVGNVVSRGNPAMEWVLEKKLPFLSGPEWLSKNILQNQHVIAIAGTHGKTTTSSMMAWILEYAGKTPNFLIGGVPENFNFSARMGEGNYFVIEADEYDSAFFDKRSKFIHYHPDTLVMNNLEFDHADIFSDLAAIQQQFHYLVRTVPGNGVIIYHAEEPNLSEVLSRGCWTPLITFAGIDSPFQAELIKQDGSHFILLHEGKQVGEVHWQLLGKHNIENALAVITAAHHLGIPIKTIIAALPLFKNVKRRLEIKGECRGITVYDDFAHHPTAITKTLSGLRAKVGKERILVVLEFGSYTMRTGVHQETMKDALTMADMVICKRPASENWDIESILMNFSQPTALYDEVDNIVEALVKELQPGDHVIVMSNSGFDGIHQKILDAIPMAENIA